MGTIPLERSPGDVVAHIPYTINSACVGRGRDRHVNFVRPAGSRIRLNRNANQAFLGRSRHSQDENALITANNSPVAIASAG